MARFASIALIDAAAERLGAARAWRDDTLLPREAALAGARQSQMYGAFNAGQLALVTQVVAEEAPQPGAPPDAPAGVRVRRDLAALTYEMRQPGTSDQDDAGILYSVRFTVPGDWTEEFDRWYEDEHIPMIYDCRHWSMTRRYCFAGSGPGVPTHLALHYLSDARGLDAPQLKAARTTPWRNKFLGQRWFTDVEKMIYFQQTPADRA